jgi:hypothetical protein
MTDAVENRPPESASLLRRLGEAADGYRDNRNRWVVADRRFPHRVEDVYLTEAEAVAATAAANAADPGAEYDWFGPYRTAEPTPVPPSDEDVVRVTVLMRNGKTKEYDGAKYDALFWTLEAFDKFVGPYLAKVGNAAYAAEERRKYIEGRSPLANSKAISHYRHSL